MRSMIALLNHYEELFEQVEIKPMEDIRELIEDTVQAKECYNNAWNCVTSLQMFGYDAQYVVGISEGLIPLDHAWICVEGVYYDPTWEIHNHIREKYFVVAKLEISDLVTVITNNNMCPPSSYEILSMQTDYVQNADKVREFMKGIVIPE